MEGTCRIQIYDLESYELVRQIILENMVDTQFTDLSLVIDDAFIIGSHSEGFFSVVKCEEGTVTESIESPFGQVENTWGVEVLGSRAEGEP